MASELEDIPFEGIIICTLYCTVFFSFWNQQRNAEDNVKEFVRYDDDDDNILFYPFHFRRVMYAHLIFRWKYIQLNEGYANLS